MQLKRINVLALNVHVTTLQEIISLIEFWTLSDQSHTICLSNVHMCMEAHDDPKFKTVVNCSDLVLPDGKPISISQRLLGCKQARQVRGTDLTNELCRLSHLKGYRIGFYGASQKTLDKLQFILKRQFLNINIVFLESPPYRPLTLIEDQNYISKINQAKVDFLFVGLGCPKQEIWMANHRDSLRCTMLGVGAAFDFISGNKPPAPKVMQDIGLEWFYRLCCEPRRLFYRYFVHNTRFLLYFSVQFLYRYFKSS